MPTIKASDEMATVGIFTPPGVVQPFAGSTAPSGWLLCIGQAISQTTYKALYDTIGYTWGNPGSNQFNLPDLRGVFVKGAGTTTRTAGKDSAGNFYAGSLGTYLTDKMQGHYHSLSGVRNYIYTDVGTINVAGGPMSYNPYGYAADLSVTASTNDGTNGAPRSGLTTEPQSAGMNYIIKY